jgi:cation:H+ antiporter
MVLSYLLLVIGLIVLIVSADVLVKGTVNIAKALKISSFIIGITIVALGTSLPEFIISLSSALSGNSDIAVGNIIGSNIANILLVVGICASFTTLQINPQIAKFELPFSVFVTALLAILGLDIVLFKQNTNTISNFDGFIFLVILAIFLYLLYIKTKKGSALSIGKHRHLHSLNQSNNTHHAVSIVYIIAGLIGLIIGQNLFIDNVKIVAQTLGMSDLMIGLTVVAIGTSLPELITSIIATLRGEVGLTIGNILGSNILNILFILGTTSAITPITLGDTFPIDIMICTITSIILIIFIYIGKKYTIARWQGGVFVLLYIAYIAFLIYR